MVISTHRIKVVTEFIQKGLSRARDGYRNFNQGLAVSTSRMKELQTKQGKWHRGMRESRTGMGRLSLGVRKATHGMRGFRMEMLGVMFFGMMLQRVFTGLLKTSLEWTGVTEILTAALGILFLPVAEWVLEWAIKFLNWVSELTESQKKWIGSLVILGAALGGVLFLIGTFALGIGSIILVFGALLTPIGLVLAAFVALAGYFILKDFFIDIGDAAEKADEKLTGFGITGAPIAALLQGMKDKLPAIKEFFSGLRDKIGTWISDALPALIEGGADILLSLVDGIINNIDEIESALDTLFTKIGDYIEANAGKLLEIGARILGAIVKGIVEGALKFGFGIGAVILEGLGVSEERIAATRPTLPSAQEGGFVARPGLVNVHAGETIIPARGGGEVIMNVTYNVVVSDKREFEGMLAENNRTLTEDVRRSIGG